MHEYLQGMTMGLGFQGNGHNFQDLMNSNHKVSATQESVNFD